MKYLPEKHEVFLYQLSACPECDLLLPRVIPGQGKKTVCPRCGRILLRHRKNSVSRSLAVGLSGLFLYFPAIALPLMTFQKLGLSDSSNVLGTVTIFYGSGYYFVALMVLFSAVIFPLCKLSLLVIVTSFIALKKSPAFIADLFRLYNHFDGWAMIEVYLLGIMVTIIKMHHSMTITFDIGFFCFTTLVILTMTASVTINKDWFWHCIEKFGNREHPVPFQGPALRASHFSAVSAAGSGLTLCQVCRKLSYSPAVSEIGRSTCPRCHAALHTRKPASIAITSALILTAAILFIPANILPIMRVEFLGIPKDSTILDGIRIFFQDGSYAIALIILMASILIPIFKIVGLAIVLLTIHFHQANYLRQKTTMFRYIEFIGKWSMLDIFVIALLAAYVNFGFLTSIAPAPAATYFCLAIVATMAAAVTFDPRAMWDVLGKEGRHMQKTPNLRG